MCFTANEREQDIQTLGHIFRHFVNYHFNLLILNRQQFKKGDMLHNLFKVNTLTIYMQSTQ